MDARTRASSVSTSLYSFSTRHGSFPRPGCTAMVNDSTSFPRSFGRMVELHTSIAVCGRSVASSGSARNDAFESSSDTRGTVIDPDDDACDSSEYVDCDCISVAGASTAGLLAPLGLLSAGAD